MIKPRTLLGQIAALEELGATPDLLGSVHLKLRGNPGHHVSGCSRAPQGTKERAVSLSHVEGLCSCLDDALSAAPSSSLAGACGRVLDALDTCTRLSTPPLPKHPVELTYSFRLFSPVFADVPERTPWPEFETVLAEARTRVVQGYESLKAELRSGAHQESLLSVLGADPGEECFVALDGYRKPERADLTDALVASYWKHMPKPGYFVLRCPRSVADHLASRTSVTSVLRARARDDEAVLETASALWTPTTSDELSDFARAMAAARAL